MKRLSIILLFLLIPFSFPTFISAQTASTSSATTTTTNSSPNLWSAIWSWIFGLFAKVDYNIEPNRDTATIKSDMTDYGDLNKDIEYKNKHSSAGSRSTELNTQTCFKGSVIKKVILKTTGYPNSDLTKICFNAINKCVIKPLDVTSENLKTENLTNCNIITIKDLAHYFVQLNTTQTKKQFYCASDKNQLIDIGQDVIDQVNKDYSTDIPENELTCYQGIYEDLYLTPKETTDKDEENTKKMMQTPISNKDQNPNQTSSENRTQLDKNFSPDGTSAGLYGLRPEKEQ